MKDGRVWSMESSCGCYENKIWTTGMFSVLQPQTWLMCCFYSTKIHFIAHSVTQAAGEKTWRRTQRGSLMTSTFGWDPHQWIPHLGLIRSELARSWTHRSEQELKEADEVGVLWKQASATLSAWKLQWGRRCGSDLTWVLLLHNRRRLGLINRHVLCYNIFMFTKSRVWGE